MLVMQIILIPSRYNSDNSLKVTEAEDSLLDNANESGKSQVKYIKVQTSVASFADSIATARHELSTQSFKASQYKSIKMSLH